MKLWITSGFLATSICSSFIQKCSSTPVYPDVLQGTPEAEHTGASLRQAEPHGKLGSLLLYIFVLCVDVTYVI